eukprot:4276069-Heterocapsa_arctica.AAC.1
MASFNNLRDDWMGIEEIVDPNTQPNNIAFGIGEIADPNTHPDNTPHGTKTNNISPLNSFASHLFSLSPMQPLTPINRSSAVAVSPTQAWNDGDIDNRSPQRQTVVTASPRINLDGVPASSSGSLPLLPPKKFEPRKVDQHTRRGNDRDVSTENIEREEHDR